MQQKNRKIESFFKSDNSNEALISTEESALDSIAKENQTGQ